MINEHNTYAFCCEDISKIENYDKAMVDKTQTWHCHHKGEILPCGRYSKDTLKKFGLYYNQPADRLIFLTGWEHKHIHYAEQKLSEETKKKISISLTGKKQTEHTRQKRANSLKGHRPWSRGKPSLWKGKHHSEESRKKMSEAHKGKNLSEETRQKLHEACKNPSEETRRKLSVARKGKHWYNNGIKNVFTYKCPEGFTKGKIRTKF